MEDYKKPEFPYDKIVSLVLPILYSFEGAEFLHEQNLTKQTECIFMQNNGRKELLAEITREELLVGLSKEKLRDIGERYERFRRNND